MRKGTLTDAETLGFYEDGVSIIALAVHEGMTAYGVISRLSRARRERRGGLSAMRGGRVTRKRRDARPVDSWQALRRAVAQLEAITR